MSSAAIKWAKKWQKCIDSVSNKSWSNQVTSRKNVIRFANRVDISDSPVKYIITLLFFPFVLSASASLAGGIMFSTRSSVGRSVCYTIFWKGMNRPL